MRNDFFDLAGHRAAKAAPHLVAADQEHFRKVAERLEQAVLEVSAQLDTARLAPIGPGQRALDRDLEVRRLTARLRLLRRHDLEVCLGRMVAADGTEPVYVGRIGLADADGRRLLVDWRTPAAEPFFAATLAHPHGLSGRRRYRWSRGRIVDYWDEVFDLDSVAGDVALDDDSAFLASLGSSRSSRMRDVLATIQADQDAIIRASARGPLVVEGGPGTGKTVVALHRAAYLLYADPHLQRGGDVLFVGPYEDYLAYVADVLPGLGEDSVQTCTLRELVPEGAAAGAEERPETARLKASAALLAAVDRAVAGYETPPSEPLVVETPWAEVEVSAQVWAEAFDAADPALPHNEARDDVWEALLDILLDQVDGDEVPGAALRRYLAGDPELTSAFRRAWPLLDPAGVVADLWSSPAFLRRCAPWLSAGEVRLLQRDDAWAWTASDLPFLDAARRRIGDADAAPRRRRREAARAAEREERNRVMEELIAADDSEMQVMSILRGQDAQNSLADEAALPGADPATLAGPYAHVVVDEAQELTDAEWRMLIARCPSRSFTVVGDRAQARRGFPESWEERLERVGLGRIRRAALTLNYRTPAEVMAEAEPVIRAVLPDASVPTSVRSTGLPVRRGRTSELRAILDAWLDEHEEGTACVLGDGGLVSTARVRVLRPEQAKGLEFDLVVLVDPSGFGSGVQGAVDHYVAMTRTTQQLVVLEPA